MIRLATQDDMGMLSALLQQLGYQTDLLLLKQALMVQDSCSAIYVYELEAHVVGFISTIRLFYFPALQYLTRITATCVTEQYRSSGIGSQLLNFVEDLAIRRGDIAVEATCSMRRSRAHQFYLQQGYTQHSYKFIKNLSLR